MKHPSTTSEALRTLVGAKTSNLRSARRQILSSLGYTSLTSTKHRWELRERGLALALQFGLPSSAGISGEGQLTQHRIATVYRFLPPAVLALRLADMFRTSVFIYDESRKTAWLCPQILLILHLLRLELIRLGHTTNLDSITFPITSINKQIKYHSQAIEDLLGVSLTEGYTYGHIITKLANLYEEAFSNLSRVQRGNQLLGFELNDLLHTGRTISPRILPIGESIKQWSPLVDTGDLVFCTGLGDAISAKDNQRDCAVTPIPGQNILVCPIYLLKELLLENGCCIHGHFAYVEKKGDDGYKWELTGNPFRCTSDSREHCDTIMCWTNRLQRVVPASKVRDVITARIGSLKSVEGRLETLELGLDREVPTMTGAICFGKVRQSKPRK